MTAQELQLLMQQFAGVQNPQQQVEQTLKPGTSGSSTAAGQVRTQQQPGATTAATPSGAQVHTGTGYQQFAPIRVSDVSFNRNPAGGYWSGGDNDTWIDTPASSGFSIANQTQYGFPDVMNQKNYQFDVGDTDDEFSLLVKSGEGAGTRLRYVKQGDYYVPQVVGTERMKTNRYNTFAGDLLNIAPLGALAGAAYLAGPYLGGSTSAGLEGATASIGGVSEGVAPVVSNTLTPLTPPAASGTLGSGTFGVTTSQAPLAAGLGTGTAGTGATVGTGVGTVGTVSSAAPVALGSAPAIGAAASNYGLVDIIRGVGDFMGGVTGFLGGINNLGGGSTTSNRSGTETKQTQLSPEAIMEIVRKILEDPTMGMQSIMRPAAGGGYFNSSNQALMTSNLLNRAAGTAALASAPTTTTASSSGKDNKDTFIEELLKRWF